MTSTHRPYHQKLKWNIPVYITHKLQRLKLDRKLQKLKWKMPVYITHKFSALKKKSIHDILQFTIYLIFNKNWILLIYLIILITYITLHFFCSFLWWFNMIYLDNFGCNYRIYTEVIHLNYSFEWTYAMYNLGYISGYLITSHMCNTFKMVYT